jgi:MFS transporter, SP family, solute carrier family 2 (myo-inositol transporter), member 13
MATTQYSRIRDPVDTDSDTSSLHPGDAYEASPPDGIPKPQPSSLNLTPYTLRLTLIASISGLLFGYDTGIISSTLLYLSPNPSPVNPPPSLTPGRVLTPFEKSLITSATSLTALLASLCIGPILDSWGRKFAIYLSAFFFVFGAAFQGTSFNVWSMVLGRMVVGLGVGLGSGVVPVWVGEVCRKEERGRLVVGLVGGITAGQARSEVLRLAEAQTLESARTGANECRL